MNSGDTAARAEGTADTCMMRIPSKKTKKKKKKGRGGQKDVAGTPSVVAAPAASAASEHHGGNRRGEPHAKGTEKGKGKFQGPALASFWHTIPIDRQRSLTSVLAEEVLQSLKDQKHIVCTCQACTRHRNTLDEEFTLLFEDFLGDLDVLASNGGDTGHPAKVESGAARLPRGDKKPNLGWFDFNETFALETSFDGRSLIVVNRRFLNDGGTRLIHMLEHLDKSRTMLKAKPSTKEPDELDSLLNTVGVQTREGFSLFERQGIGKQLIQLFVAKTFERRILTVYREKVALDNQELLIAEEEEAAEAQRAREEAKKAAKLKKKQKKERQKQNQLEEQRRKLVEAEAAAAAQARAEAEAAERARDEERERIRKAQAVADRKAAARQRKREEDQKVAQAEAQKLADERERERKRNEADVRQAEREQIEESERRRSAVTHARVQAEHDTQLNVSKKRGARGVGKDTDLRLETVDTALVSSTTASQTSSPRMETVSTTGQDVIKPRLEKGASVVLEFPRRDRFNRKEATVLNVFPDGRVAVKITSEGPGKDKELHVDWAKLRQIPAPLSERTVGKGPTTASGAGPNAHALDPVGVPPRTAGAEAAHDDPCGYWQKSQTATSAHVDSPLASKMPRPIGQPVPFNAHFKLASADVSGAEPSRMDRTAPSQPTASQTTDPGSAMPSPRGMRQSVPYNGYSTAAGGSGSPHQLPAHPPAHLAPGDAYHMGELDSRLPPQPLWTGVDVSQPTSGAIGMPLPLGLSAASVTAGGLNGGHIGGVIGRTDPVFSTHGLATVHGHAVPGGGDVSIQPSLSSYAEVSAPFGYPTHPRAFGNSIVSAPPPPGLFDSASQPTPSAMRPIGSGRRGVGGGLDGVSSEGTLHNTLPEVSQGGNGFPGSLGSGMLHGADEFSNAEWAAPNLSAASVEPVLTPPAWAVSASTEKDTLVPDLSGDDLRQDPWAHTPASAQPNGFAEL
mmetsp:Transcript_9274/g.23840  ORF Transcript_9274/g.23840 Transcript_9274/m.23840 type:complete len:965 (-) Transcript_9274:51-2945(-)